MAKRPDKQLTKQPARPRVVRWEGFGWGVAFNRGNGKHDAYPVGSREEAETEAERLQFGARPRSPSSIARLVKGQLSRRHTE